jgi:hypothetical protein
VANAQVEKLKALGLRHGEKAVVTLAGVLCLLFLFFAVTKKTIDLTPDQVAEAAKQADSRLAARQPADDVLKQIEDQGIKNPGFLTLVEKQSKEALVADVYRPARPWVTPEPGAGSATPPSSSPPPTCSPTPAAAAPPCSRWTRRASGSSTRTRASRRRRIGPPRPAAAGRAGAAAA